jgi:hypothetical protein
MIFYFILFYFILFYFILFYFILFLYFVHFPRGRAAPTLSLNLDAMRSLELVLQRVSPTRLPAACDAVAFDSEANRLLATSTAALLLRCGLSAEAAPDAQQVALEPTQQADRPPVRPMRV